MEYTDEQLRDVIERAVGEFATEGHPRWYAITGSHTYGFDSASSDIDIRGFHTVDETRYAYLDRAPKQEVTINMQGTTDGYEHVADVDLRSYELRHFGEHIVGANYNAMELLFCADAVMNGVPLAMDALRELVSDFLPLDVPHTYMGMAKSNYYSYLDPDKTEAYDPNPKKFLYVYRGMLGSIYTHENAEIVADVRTLARDVDMGRPEIVDELIECKRDASIDKVPADLEEETRMEISGLFNAQPEFTSVSTYEKESFMRAIDEWMQNVRRV